MARNLYVVLNPAAPGARGRRGHACRHPRRFARVARRGLLVRRAGLHAHQRRSLGYLDSKASAASIAAFSRDGETGGALATFASSAPLTPPVTDGVYGLLRRRRRRRERAGRPGGDAGHPDLAGDGILCHPRRLRPAPADAASPMGASTACRLARTAERRPRLARVSAAHRREPGPVQHRRLLAGGPASSTRSESGGRTADDVRDADRAGCRSNGTGFRRDGLLLVSGQSGPSATSSAIVSLAVETGAQVVVATLPSSTAIAVDDACVYFSTSTGIFSPAEERHGRCHPLSVSPADAEARGELPRQGPGCAFAACGASGAARSWSSASATTRSRPCGRRRCGSVLRRCCSAAWTWLRGQGAAARRRRCARRSATASRSSVSTCRCSTGARRSCPRGCPPSSTPRSRSRARSYARVRHGAAHAVEVARRRRRVRGRRRAVLVDAARARAAAGLGAILVGRDGGEPRHGAAQARPAAGSVRRQRRRVRDRRRRSRARSASRSASRTRCRRPSPPPGRSST